MENKFGKKEKIIIGIVVIAVAFFIFDSFVLDNIRREKSVEEMKKVTPAIQCGIECRNQAYDIKSPDFDRCVSACLSSENNNLQSNNDGSLVELCKDDKVVELEGVLEIIQSKYPINAITTAERTYWMYGAPDDFDKNLNKRVRLEAILSPAGNSPASGGCNICTRQCENCQCPIDQELLYNVKILEVLDEANRNICGPKSKGSNYDISNCDKSCRLNSDCKFTCGCGAINKNEACDDEGILYDCTNRQAICKNGQCIVGEEIINNTRCNTDGRGRVFGDCFNDCVSRINGNCTFSCPHYAADFNRDPANITVKYSNQELGILFEAPFNEGWGKENCQVKPYGDYDQKYKTISFGRPGGWEAADEFVLTIRDSKTADDLISNIKKDLGSELVIDADIEVLNINNFDVVKWFVYGMHEVIIMEAIGKNNNYRFSTYLGGSTKAERITELTEIISSFSETNIIPVKPSCQDGYTYLSYYPNPNNDIEFPGDFSPSEELKKVRVAYFTDFACSESEEEGYYIKQNDVFKKVEKDEFDKFIDDYNISCGDCLTEHFDGCC